MNVQGCARSRVQQKSQVRVCVLQTCAVKSAMDRTLALGTCATLVRWNSNDGHTLARLAESSTPPSPPAGSPIRGGSKRHGNRERCRTKRRSAVRARQRAAGRHAALPLVNAAHATPRSFDRLDALCDAFLTNPVANRASRVQGRALIATGARTWPTPRADFPRGGGQTGCGHLGAGLWRDDASAGDSAAGRAADVPVHDARAACSPPPSASGSSAAIAPSRCSRRAPEISMRSWRLRGARRGRSVADARRSSTCCRRRTTGCIRGCFSRRCTAERLRPCRLLRFRNFALSCISWQRQHVPSAIEVRR